MTKYKKTYRQHGETGKGQDHIKNFIAGVVGVIVVLYVVLIAIAICHPHLAERVKFGTENGLSLAILIAVVAQVVIYRAQWLVMDQSLKIPHRAYVGIHSITNRLDTGQVLLLIENIGKVPAGDVEIHLLIMRTFGDPQLEPVMQRYDMEWTNTHLFPGNLKIPVLISLEAFGNGDREAVMAGMQSLTIGGYVLYDDGFDVQQRTNVRLYYFGHPFNEWLPGPIDDDELRVEETLAVAAQSKKERPTK